jgi:hypothetical protein
MNNSSLKSAFILLICTVFSLSFSSCKKDEVKKSRSELIIGNWLLSSDLYNPAYDADGNGTTETEIFPLYSACAKDDFLTFNTGGTGAFDQGPLMCQGGSPEQRTPFTWSLYNNDHSLVLGGTSYAVLELSETTLKIADTFFENNVTYTNTYTFTKK